MILIAGWGCVFDDVTLTYYLDFNCIHCPYVHFILLCLLLFLSLSLCCNPKGQSKSETEFITSITFRTTLKLNVGCCWPCTGTSI